LLSMGLSYSAGGVLTGIVTVFGIFRPNPVRLYIHRVSGMWIKTLNGVVRLTGFEPATFGSGDRRSSPAELQAHKWKILDLTPKSNP
jgi:hypothetical protein